MEQTALNDLTDNEFSECVVQAVNDMCRNLEFQNTVPSVEAVGEVHGPPTDYKYPYNSNNSSVTVVSSPDTYPVISIPNLEEYLSIYTPNQQPQNPELREANIINSINLQNIKMVAPNEFDEKLSEVTEDLQHDDQVVQPQVLCETQEQPKKGKRVCKKPVKKASSDPEEIKKTSEKATKNTTKSRSKRKTTLESSDVPAVKQPKKRNSKLTAKKCQCPCLCAETSDSLCLLSKYIESRLEKSVDETMSSNSD